MSGISEIAAYSPSPIADYPSLSSSTSSPSSSQELFLSVHLVLDPVYQLLYCTTVLFKVLYWKIKNVLFLCLFFYALFVW